MLPTERYHRQIALPGFGLEAQQRLAAARVLVVGAGGLGSTVIPALAAVGAGTLGIIDDDRVELSNLHRQVVHSMADIGREKVLSAAESVHALNPEVTVQPHRERLTSANALAILAQYQLVIDGCDNFATRYLVSDATELRGIPLIWGAVSQYGGQAGLSLPAGPGYRDLFPAPPPPGSVLSCAEGGVLPTTVGVIGSLMATEAIKAITGIGEPLAGRVVVFDALRSGFREISYRRDPTRSPVTGLADGEAFCGVAPTAVAETAAAAPTVAAAELAAMDRSTLTLIDVREPWEADIASIPGSLLAPLSTLAGTLPELDATKPVIVYCHHGVRSEHAYRLLAEHGFSAQHLDGGIDAWARLVDPAMERY